MMESERILLRQWRESDAEALFKYAGDPDVGPRAGWPPHKSVEESLEIIRTVFGNDTTWAIELKETGEAIGAIGYGPSCDCNLPAREGEPITGYWIAKPYWNQGICTDALTLMIEHIRRYSARAWSERYRHSFSCRICLSILPPHASFAARVIRQYSSSGSDPGSFRRRLRVRSE